MKKKSCKNYTQAEKENCTDEILKPASLNTSEPLVKIGKVASTLGVSVSCIRKWCEQGVLVPTKTEGGHRLFSLHEILKRKDALSERSQMATNLKEEKTVQLTSLDSTANSFLERTKKLRAEKRHHLDSLRICLEKLCGDATDLNLSFSTKLFRNLQDDSVKYWHVLYCNGKKIFVANHFEGEVFEYKAFPLHSEETYIPGLAEKLATSSVLMEAFKSQGRIVKCEKISNPQRDSLEGLLNALSHHLACL